MLAWLALLLTRLAQALRSLAPLVVLAERFALKVRKKCFSPAKNKSSKTWVPAMLGPLALVRQWVKAQSSVALWVARCIRSRVAQMTRTTLSAVLTRLHKTQRPLRKVKPQQPKQLTTVSTPRSKLSKALCTALAWKNNCVQLKWHAWVSRTKLLNWVMTLPPAMAATTRNNRSKVRLLKSRRTQALAMQCKNKLVQLRT